MSEQVNDGGPAMPTMRINGDGCTVTRTDGLSIRDYFAAKAMQALMTDYEVTREEWPDVDDTIAREAYATADAMLKARTNHPAT